MRPHAIVAGSLCLAALVLCQAVRAQEDDTAAVVKGNTAFACELYGRLAAKEGNLFLSPYSISTALAMTWAGARGETEQQMAQVLHFGLDQARLHPAFRALQANVMAKPSGRAARDGQPLELHVANALWGQKGYPFVAAFLKTTRQHYGAGLREVDFKRDAEAARQTINKWVEDQTKNKIKDLIGPGVLDAMTRLVLTNAVYFKAAWEEQFRKANTREADFTLIDGTTVKAPMMAQTHGFRYAGTDDLQLLEMPYVGGTTSMVVLLPKKVDGLPALEKALTADALAGWLGALRSRSVNVTLPRFKTTSQFLLSQTLKAMGMPTAFSGRADFSAMGPNLCISEVIHKGFVDVNEWGTEAAAATAVVMRLTSAAPSQPVTFRADHPFLFLIRHRATGSILFIGRIADPTK